MNSHNPSNKLIILCFIGLLLQANESYAVDMGVLQEQCAEIGFKAKTLENGKCVLRLMKTVVHQKAKKNAQLRADAILQEQQSKYEAEAQRTNLNNQQIAQSQAYRQQQAAQQQVTQQQNESGVGTTILNVLGVTVQLLGAGVQGYNQGVQQSAATYRPTTAHCSSALSPWSKQIETTCTQY